MVQKYGILRQLFVAELKLHKGILEVTTLTTVHRQAVKSEQLKQKSYFTVKEKEINKNIDKSYLAVFKALYWITKEEVANLKSKSLLSLLEELGVNEIESFSTRSEKKL